MPYYPLSQIQIDLFTNGNEYVFANDLSPYKGSYHKISNGKYYSENIPKNKSQEILLINEVNGQPLKDQIIFPETENVINIINRFSTDSATTYDDKNNIIYNGNTSNYVSDAQSRIIPSSYYPVLSQEQKNSGQFIRYFTKKTNELKYIEIDKLTYNALKSKNSGIAFDLYEPTSLIWRIKGDKTEIFNSNKGAVLTKEQQLKWPGFFKYFKDKFTQFYIELNTQENLYTSGGEFTTPDGKEYIGPYHVHPEKGPMVGAVHIKRKHDLLTPITPSAPQIEPTPQPTPTPSTPPPPSIGGGGYSGGGGGY
tara:strand:+ start:501 stop:1427 length:927 start_codon:yes stop_codon:yes gene_type:complete